MTKDEAMRIALEALGTVREWEVADYDPLENAITALRQALEQPEQEPFEMKWPDYNESAMGCGIEDRNITDRYEAMQYGWDEAISRVSECLPDVLFTAPPSKQEPDYGIDRGAWSDVPDATKWVDELRGDEDSEPEPVAMRYGWDGHGYQYIDNGSGSDWRERHKDGEPLYAAPPKPAQDLIVGYADSYDLTRDGHDFWVSRQPGKHTVPLYLYGHPPKIWQGLTDEELSEIYNKNYDDYVSENIGIVDFLMIAGAVEATLKDKNRG